MACRHPGPPGFAARQAMHRDDDQQHARQDLQHDAIQSEAEGHRGGHERDRCGMPDRDRHQGPQRLRPITRLDTPGGGQHPTGGRIQAVKGADPCDRQP